MGLWDAMARRADKSAAQLYETLYRQAWSQLHDTSPGQRHALADLAARRGSSSQVPDPQLDTYEVEALTRTAVALGEPAGFEFVWEVLRGLWEVECDRHFGEVIRDCRRLTSNPLTIAAWTLRWCVALADVRVRLMNSTVGQAAHPSLVQASARVLGAELGVSGDHAVATAREYTITTHDRVEQLIAWARQTQAATQ